MPEIIECESGSYSVVDIYGLALDVGSPVRYGGTGTTGYISEITCDSEGAWAEIDSTGLLYKLESLTLLDTYEAKEEIGERKFTRKEIQDSLENLEDEAKRAQLDDTNIESGG